MSRKKRKGIRWTGGSAAAGATGTGENKVAQPRQGNPAGAIRRKGLA